MAARDVPVRARARRSKVGMYAGSLPWGPIPSVLRRQDAATVLIHGCGSSATSCRSVACVVVILSKAREAMRSFCAVSWFEGTRASDEPVCGAEGQGSTWWSGRWRAVLSHDASFGQDERQNLQPRQDGHQHADARRSGGRGRAPQPEHCQDFRYSPAIFKTGTIGQGSRTSCASN